MAGPLHPDNLPAGRDRIVGRGHGTEALGPSDSSDSGSDLIGASADVGDADLDSDTDRQGTGERAAGTRDEAKSDAPDIDTDHIEEIDVGEGEEDESQ